MTRSDVERFWAKVERGAECWTWLGARTAEGYGQFNVGGRILRAHRVSSELADGPIPEGVHVLHRCDNPPCVRPDHLFRGDAALNAADRVAKGREADRRGERNGRARLTARQVVAIRRKYATGRRSQMSLAAEYDVGQVTVSEIIRRVTWAHVSDRLDR